MTRRQELLDALSSWLVIEDPGRYDYIFPSGVWTGRLLRRARGRAHKSVILDAVMHMRWAEQGNETHYKRWRARQLRALLADARQRQALRKRVSEHADSGL